MDIVNRYFSQYGIFRFVVLITLVLAAAATWCWVHPAGKPERQMPTSYVVPETMAQTDEGQPVSSTASNAARADVRSTVPREDALVELPQDILTEPSIPKPMPAAKPDPHFVELPQITAVLNPLRERWAAIQSMNAKCVITTTDADGNTVVNLAGSIHVDQSGPYSIDTVDSVSGKRYSCSYDGTVCRELFGEEQSLSFAPTLPSLLFADMLAKSTQYETVETVELHYPDEKQARSVFKITSRQAGCRIYVDRSDGNICRSEKFEANTERPYWTADFGKLRKLPDGSVVYTEIKAAVHVKGDEEMTSRQVVQLENFDIKRTTVPALGSSDEQR